VPPGYSRVARPGVVLVARDDVAPAITAAMATVPLYEWAATLPRRRELHGRAPAYAVQLPDTETHVVVRRNHHGGLLGPLLGDRFVLSRAPIELAISRVFAQRGIPTPEVLAHATYTVNWLQRRVDVVTQLLPAGRDLGEVLLQGAAGPERDAQWHAVGELLRSLRESGAWHRDLNVKNIYLIEEPPAPPRAAVLDVDRILFDIPGPTVAEANLARLARSLRKWRATRGATISDAEIKALGAMLRVA
jgi:hypothetical protein